MELQNASKSQFIEGVVTDVQTDYLSPNVGSTHFALVGSSFDSIELSADSEEQARLKFMQLLGSTFPTEYRIIDVSHKYDKDRNQLYARKFYDEQIHHGLPSAQFALQGAKWFECCGFTCIAEDHEHAVMKFNGLIPAVFPHIHAVDSVREVSNLDFQDALGLFFYIVRRA